MSPPRDDDRDRERPSRPAPEEGTGAGDGSALAPDELDIEDDENVVRLDDDRFVIGTDERPTVPDDAHEGRASADERSGDAPADGDAVRSGSDATATDPGGFDAGSVMRELESDLEATSARYGFHVTAKAEDAISHQQLSSDDVGTVFDGLLRWYAQQLTTETAVEDVLGILLTESNVRVRYSPSCLQAILEAYDLGPDDTIADLVEAVQDDRGMVFPPENV